MITLNAFVIVFPTRNRGNWSHVTPNGDNVVGSVICKCGNVPSP